MLIKLNVHFLQYQSLLILQDMFVQKIEKLNQEKKLNKLLIESYLSIKKAKINLLISYNSYPLIIKEKPLVSQGLFIKSRQCPTLPRGCPPSTIGANGLNFRVRNGNGCIPTAITTVILNFLKILQQALIRRLQFKPSTYQYQSAEYITVLTLLTYQPHVL